jgi:2,4-dienoyl-CoA reductase-like NADH-dependent reductase (Old Yellow Enzyme family)
VPDALYEPLRLRGLELQNRVALSPMCQYSARDGFPGEWHLRHYAERSVGGAGLVMVEATAVLPEGRITPQDLGIWDEEHAQALSRIARAIKEGGAAAGIQLAHAGRKASTSAPWEGGSYLPPERGGWGTAAPSPLPFGEGHAAPEALDEAGIALLVSAFAAAARRAVAAGFDLVELHSAHGYLLHQFLSPLSNERQDRWGGSLENRMRLALEAASALRSALPPSMPLLARVSATDWAAGGWDPASTIELARAFKGLGVDLVDVSSGGLLPKALPPVAPLYQVPFAEALRREAAIPVGAVGLITEAGEARGILEEGRADLLSFGRLLLRDPYWPMRNAPRERRRAPLQYLRAFPSS